MDKNISHNVINKINEFKLQIIINRHLYLDEVITKKVYELVENTLLEKIDIITNKMEMCL